MKKLMKIWLTLTGTISIATLPLIAAACAQTKQEPAAKKTSSSNANDSQTAKQTTHNTKKTKTPAELELEQKTIIKTMLLARMSTENAKQDIMNDMSDVRSKYINDLKTRVSIDIKNKEQVDDIFKDVDANPSDPALIKPLIQKIRDYVTNMGDEEFMFGENFVYDHFSNKITPEDYITLFYQLNDIYNQNKETVANNLYKFLSFTKDQDYPTTNEGFNLEWAKEVVSKVPEFVQVFDVIANAPIYKKYNINAFEIASWFVEEVSGFWGTN